MGLTTGSGSLPAKKSRARRVGIYLPIAEMSVNVFVLLAMGAAAEDFFGSESAGDAVIENLIENAVKYAQPGRAPVQRRQAQ